VVAVHGSLVEECPVVSRVRDLLGRVEEAMHWSQDEVERGLGDLEDVANRLARLRIFFPDLRAEEGPRVSWARSLLEGRLSAAE